MITHRILDAMVAYQKSHTSPPSIVLLDIAGMFELHVWAKEQCFVICDSGKNSPPKIFGLEIGFDWRASNPVVK